MGAFFLAQLGAPFALGCIGSCIDFSRSIPCLCGVLWLDSQDLQCIYELICSVKILKFSLLDDRGLCVG
jgi:hypothetical protein